MGGDVMLVFGALSRCNQWLKHGEIDDI